MLDSAIAWILQRTWDEIAEAVFVLLSIIGQHYNSERNKVGFYFWGTGNAIAIILFVSIGRWLTAVLYCYFLLKCVTGIKRWTQIELEEGVRAQRPTGALAGHQSRHTNTA